MGKVELLLASQNNPELIGQAPSLMEAGSNHGIIAVMPFVDNQGSFHLNSTRDKESLKLLRASGYRTDLFDPNTLNPKTFRKIIRDTVALYIFGGNPWRLLRASRSIGLHQVLPHFIADGGMFIGVSAGAMLAGVSVEPANYHPMVEKKDFTPRKEGLHLVEAIVWPHYNEKHERSLQRLPDELRNQRIIKLSNCQAAIVNGEVKIIEPKKVESTTLNPESSISDSEIPLKTRVKQALTAAQQFAAQGESYKSDVLKSLILDCAWLNGVFKKGADRYAEEMAHRKLDALKKEMATISARQKPISI